MDEDNPDETPGNRDKWSDSPGSSDQRNKEEEEKQHFQSYSSS